MTFFLWRCCPTRAMASSFTRFLDHTQRRITVGRTLLDEWPARHRDLYLTTLTKLTTDKHQCPRRASNQQSQRPQTLRAATGIGSYDRKNIYLRNPLYQWSQWVILIKVKSRNALLRKLLVRICSYIKSVLRYKVLILYRPTCHPNTLYWLEEGCEGPSLFF